MKEKVNDLVRLHEEMQEKLKTASYSEQIQILALVPDKLSWMYYSEYFNVFEYLVWTSHEIKKVCGILAKTFLKKGKTITTETPHSCNKRLWRWQFQCLKRETMLVWVSEYINKNFATCKSLYYFQRKHQNANIGFSMFCALRPKWCVLAGSKVTHSVCVCNAHQNVVLLVNAMDWDLTYKDLIKLTLSCPKYFH